MTSPASGSNKISASESPAPNDRSKSKTPIPDLDIFIKYSIDTYHVMWSGLVNGQRLETSAGQFKHYPTRTEIMETRGIAIKAFERAVAATKT